MLIDCDLTMIDINQGSAFLCHQTNKKNLTSQYSCQSLGWVSFADAHWFAMYHNWGL